MFNSKKKKQEIAKKRKESLDKPLFHGTGYSYEDNESSYGDTESTRATQIQKTGTTIATREEPTIVEPRSKEAFATSYNKVERSGSDSFCSRMYDTFIKALLFLVALLISIALFHLYYGFGGGDK